MSDWHSRFRAVDTEQEQQADRSDSANSSIGLREAIAEYLALCAKCVSKLGTDAPELDPRIKLELRDKILRQRAKVSATLTGCAPEVHVAHLESLNNGLRLILSKLAPTEPEPPKPPQPVWDDALKVWRVPDPGQVDTGNPARPFDDRLDDLFR